MRTQFRNVRGAGFSLLEILLVVSMLSVIVLGLFSMFNQTHRALKITNSQVDVMESGRAVLDVIGRDLEQIVPSGLNTMTSRNTNEFVPHLLSQVDYPVPLYQRLVDNTLRTNILQRCFFLSRTTNDAWVANGFFVASSYTTAQNGKTYLSRSRAETTGYGTLYRFTCYYQPANWSPARLTVTALRTMLNSFLSAQMREVYSPPVITRGYVNPLVDGVAHFRLRAVDPLGRVILSSLTSNAIITSSSVLGENNFYFYSNSAPASIQLELGIIESPVLKQIRAMPEQNHRNSLSNYAGAVHLFHKLIPLRNSQP
jgi:type II secretory pathway pseudopilin PulG